MSVIPDPIEATVADVAAIIRARTKDSNGFEVGTFTDATRPTDAQCQEAIDHQTILLHQKVGKVGDICAPLARMAVAIGAAAEIELSYFPEQSRTDRSPYTFLIERYEDALEGVLQCVLGDLPGMGNGDVPTGLQFGTLDAVSSVVAGYYGGQHWPPIDMSPPPVVNPLPGPDD